MSREQAKRGSILNYIIALAAIFVLNFILPRLMPGDPLHAIYGDEALVAMTPELERSLIKEFSLDRSWIDQIQAYIIGLMHGNLGFSYYYKDQVSSVIMGALPWTLLLTVLVLVIATALGIILGIESGYRRGEPLDRCIVASLMFVSGFPNFFIGILLLLLFGVALGIAPLSGAITPYAGLEGFGYLQDVIGHLILPLASLVLAQLGEIYLLTRSTMVSLMGDSFILTAKAKGCSEFSIKYSHAGRNSLLPVTTAIGLLIPQLLIRVLFIEIIFSYPGVGSILDTALYARDYPLIQGILLLITVIVLTANLIVDLLYRRLDPRVRYAH
jgi:peptide/nickel transport system permease protein